MTFNENNHHRFSRNFSHDRGASHVQRTEVFRSRISTSIDIPTIKINLRSIQRDVPRLGTATPILDTLLSASSFLNFIVRIERFVCVVNRMKKTVSVKKNILDDWRWIIRIILDGTLGMTKYFCDCPPVYAQTFHLGTDVHKL